MFKHLILEKPNLQVIFCAFKKKFAYSTLYDLASKIIREQRSKHIISLQLKVFCSETEKINCCTLEKQAHLLC